MAILMAFVCSKLIPFEAKTKINSMKANIKGINHLEQFSILIKISHVSNAYK